MLYGVNTMTKIKVQWRVNDVSNLLEAVEAVRLSWKLFMGYDLLDLSSKIVLHRIIKSSFDYTNSKRNESIIEEESEIYVRAIKENFKFNRMSKILTLIIG